MRQALYTKVGYYNDYEDIKECSHRVRRDNGEEWIYTEYNGLGDE